VQRFLNELRRRKVFKVAIVYAAVAFIIVQAADLIFPALLFPEWAFRFVVVLSLFGFPIALVLAWALEVTPDGVRATRDRGQTGESELTMSGVPSRLWWQAGITAVTVVGLLAGGLWLIGSRADSPTGDIRSLAVLPFANLSGEPGEEYFSGGMTEALISRLGGIGALTVISRTSVMRYADSEASIPEIAAELDVDAVVEGSVLRADSAVRITAKLIRAVPEEQLWSAEYVRDLRDILTLQSEVAGAIAEQVKVTLTPVEAAQLASTRRIVPEAYDAYLRGRQLWNERNQESLLRAIEYFERAIEIDSSYALAWSGLADTYVVLPAHARFPMAEAQPRAEAAARRAIALSENLGEAHAALASALWNDWQWDQVEPEYRRAIELSPNYATGRQWYGEFLSAMGRYDEAIAQLERARTLDPHSGIVPTSLARLYAAAGRDADAVALLEETLAADPDFLPAHLYLIRIHEHAGRIDAAIARRRSLPPELVRAVTGTEARALTDEAEEAYRRGGARAYFEALAEAAERTNNLPEAAEYYGLAGDRDAAFETLDRMYESRHVELSGIKGNLRWAPLRDDPRFGELLRRMGLSD
jgi:TolB-like protein/Tfp pilus assembly protein PilF